MLRPHGAASLRTDVAVHVSDLDNKSAISRDAVLCTYIALEEGQTNLTFASLLSSRYQFTGPTNRIPCPKLVPFLSHLLHSLPPLSPPSLRNSSHA